MNSIESNTVEEVKTNFRQAMSQALSDQSISKKQLATHVGVSVNTIRNILSGENFNFKVAIMVNLALDLNFFTTNDNGTVSQMEAVAEPMPA